LRKPYYRKESILVFYPHGNLAIATNLNGETVKIERVEKSIQIGKSALFARLSKNLLQSIQDAWVSERCFSLFVSEGDNVQKLRAIQRNGYLNAVYESALPEKSRTLVIYGWSMSENDNHILSKLVSGQPKKIAVSIYKTEDWEDKAFEMRKRLLNTYKQKFMNPPDEIVFYDSTSEGCWKN